MKEWISSHKQQGSSVLQRGGAELLILWHVLGLADSILLQHLLFALLVSLSHSDVSPCRAFLLAVAQIESQQISQESQILGVLDICLPIA